MVMPIEALWEKVYSQKTLIPSLYGNIDFTRTPERFAGGPDDPCLLPKRFAKKYRADIIADKDKVERARAYTMLGDIVADAYAALLPQYGVRALISMLTVACEKGLDAVEDAPPELVAFIQEMERTPEWLDMELVNEGARVTRIAMANLAPFAIRGAFVATFMNKYSGLPMALTGALSDETSVQRVKETASFFTTAAMPGALERYGAGFKAAALVRLMHSMVRANILLRSKRWNVDTHGIPVPQVDQMPAGTMPAFITAFKVIKQGRKEFTRQERAVVELCRYQSYLLGLPEDLLHSTPREIFDAMMTYGSTLRDGYDDETCGDLIRSTMGAYLPGDKSLKSQVHNFFEKSFSKVFFNQVFLVGADKSVARRMKVVPNVMDYLLFAATNAYVLPQMVAHNLAEKIPLVNDVADHFLVEKLNKLLVEYGHAEYTTDPAKYREASA